MYGSEAFERLLKGDFRPRSTILEIFCVVKTLLRGFLAINGSEAFEGVL